MFHCYNQREIGGQAPRLHERALFCCAEVATDREACSKCPASRKPQVQNQYGRVTESKNMLELEYVTLVGFDIFAYHGLPNSKLDSVSMQNPYLHVRSITDELNVYGLGLRHPFWFFR